MLKRSSNQHADSRAHQSASKDTAEYSNARMGEDLYDGSDRKNYNHRRTASL